jgi:putative ABC transport system ATP-binding protein
MNTPKVILEGKGLGLRYHDGRQETHALRGVDIAIEAGKFHGIMGPSGSGKSSLLTLISGLRTPTAGDVFFDGAPLSRLPEPARAKIRHRSFGYVFQQPFLLPWLTVVENALVAVDSRDKAARERAMAHLDSLGLADMARRFPDQLSGGERQRVAVVRALVHEPRIVFADEPTAALDQENGHRVVDALAQWRRHGAVVVVTHDAGMLRDADSVVHLQDGVRVANPQRTV